jgi:predicted nucleic acid-binding protein
VRAVLDAGPLIHLSWIDQLDLLPSLFDELIIPVGVRDEVLAAPAGTLGLAAIRQSLSGGWLQVQTPSLAVPEDLTVLLDRGEAEALHLTVEIKADIFVSDDAAARREAARRQIEVVGTIGILAQCRELGLIPEMLPYLLELRRLGQWISQALLDDSR